jgi:hypothetical protein
MGREARARRGRDGGRIKRASERRIDELFETTRQLAARGAIVDEYFATLHELAQVMKSSNGTFLSAGQRLYRATKHHTAVPQNIREISYPPAMHITTPGRCNTAGQALFFCSTDSNCVLEEVRPKENDLLVRATWRVAKRAHLMDIGYTPDVFRRAGATRDVPEGHTKFAERLDDSSRRVREFIGLAFTDPTSAQYSLTSAIANFFLRSDAVGVSYPSITRRAGCDNVAFQPTFVDEGGLELIAAEAIRVRRWNLTDPDGRGIADLKGVSADGSLCWAYTGLEVTSFPAGQVRHMFMTFGESVTCQNDGELQINNRRYTVRPGFTIESQPGVIIVKDAAGNIVAPAAISTDCPFDSKR